MDLTFEVREGASDVPRIRHAFSRALVGHAVRIDTSTAELVLTELLTNALVHGSLPIRVNVTGRHGTVRIEVCDAAPSDVPHRVRAGPASETGRGLFLVSTLASRWGVEPRSSGKAVWAELEQERPESGAHRPGTALGHANGRATDKKTGPSEGRGVAAPTQADLRAVSP